MNDLFDEYSMLIFYIIGAALCLPIFMDFLKSPSIIGIIEEGLIR